MSSTLVARKPVVSIVLLLTGAGSPALLLPRYFVSSLGKQTTM
jgi:hypothetical protein